MSFSSYLGIRPQAQCWNEKLSLKAGSVTQGLGRYITLVISQAEVRRGSWSEEEMMLLDLLMVPLGASRDVP